MDVLCNQAHCPTAYVIELTHISETKGRRYNSIRRSILSGGHH